MRLLLTGFEPFDGQSVNASWLAVQAVAATWVETGRSGVELVTACLPVSFARTPEELRALWTASRPDVVVCVGEAAGRARVGIEEVAVNRAAGEIPDNDGARPAGPVVEGAPDSYATGLPSAACLAAVLAAGVPVELSPSAGTFVCNATFFAARHLAVTAAVQGVRVGFVHVPRTPAQVHGGPGLPVEASARALRALLGVLVAPVGTP